MAAMAPPGIVRPPAARMVPSIPRHGTWARVVKKQAGVASNRAAHRRRTAARASAHAAREAWRGFEGVHLGQSVIKSDRPLPPPPKEANLAHVLPYLIKIAGGEPGALRSRLYAAIVLLVLAKALGIASPLLFKDAVDVLSAATATAHADAQTLNTCCTYLLLSGVCKCLCSLSADLRGFLYLPVAQGVGRRVALAALDHVLTLDAFYHIHSRTGSLSKVIDRGTRAVSSIFRAVVFTFVPTAAELVVVCAFLWQRTSPYTVGAVLCTFALYVVWTAVCARAMSERRKRANILDQEASARAVDAIIQHEAVSIFDNAKLEVARYGGALTEYQKAAVSSEIVSNMLNSGQSAILALGTAVALCSAVLLGSTSGATTTAGVALSAVGNLVMVNGLVLQLYAPLQFLGFFFRELRQSLVDFENLSNLLNRKSRVVDGAIEEVPGAHKGAGVAIELSNVHFAYPGPPDDINEEVPPVAGPLLGFGGDGNVNGNGATDDDGANKPMPGPRPVLHGVSLYADPGESIALVGPSGSGKSTVLKLITRAWDCDAGTVRMNGVDVRDLKLGAIKDVTAVVPQDAPLFHDTLAANVAYGRPDASREEIEAACRAARVHVVPEDHHTDGTGITLGTVVGEKGARLSGGERQRVAIARAYLRRPDLLICDEATSALDSTTEAEVLEALRAIGKGRTSVTVAHRLSTIRHCDRIYVLDKGRVKEVGTHRELLQLGGLYATLWATQSSEEEEVVAEHESVIM